MAPKRKISEPIASESAAKPIKSQKVSEAPKTSSTNAFAKAFASIAQPVKQKPATAIKKAVSNPEVSLKPKQAVTAKQTKTITKEKELPSKKSAEPKGKAQKVEKVEKVEKVKAKKALSGKDQYDRDISEVQKSFLDAKAQARGRRAPTQSTSTVKETKNKSAIISSLSHEEIKAKEAEAQRRKAVKTKRALLLEKDHVSKPVYNDVERRLSRIATKGVVTLFNAVSEQQKKLDELKNNNGLLMSQRENIIKESTQGGFLDFLKQASKTQNAKNIDNDAIRVESSYNSTARRNALIASNNSDNSDDDDDETLSLYHSAIDSDDSDDDDDDDNINNSSDDSDAVSGAPIKQRGKGGLVKSASNSRKWTILDDDYITKQTSQKMRDWENDSDSSESD